MPASCDDFRGDLETPACPEMPDAVRQAVRARRRTVIRRRAGSAGVLLCVAVAGSGLLATLGEREPRVTRIGVVASAPAIGQGSMASLRRSWSDAGELPGQDARLPADPSDSLRLGDLARVLATEL